MADNIVISRMTMDDYGEVHSLWLTIDGFGIRSIDDSKEEINRFIDRNPTTSVVAKCNGKIVGSILCGHDGRQGTLYHVCVSKEFRRRGIGTMMVAHCMECLRQMKINKVSLIAFSNNDAGNAFWKQIGWKQAHVNYYEFTLNKDNITRFVESSV